MSREAGAGLRAHVVVAREHFAVDVVLDVHPGETVAIMGPSGAGKSTLLQALAGLVPLDAGEIAIGETVVDRVDAPRVQAAPMDRGVVLLGQDARLFPHLSVRENVAFGPRSGGVDARTARADADVWLERVGLPGAGSRMPHELSGGEQQRVAVARALAASPRAVLLDEPLVALDPDTAGGIRRMLRDQLETTTTVAVTHDAADAIALADRLVVVEAGRVTQSGPVREVLARPASAFVASIAGVNRIVGTVVDGRWRSAGGIALDAAGAGGSGADAAAERGVAAVFRPGDVRRADPAAEGAVRTTVVRIEPTLAGVRVHTDFCAIDLSLSEATDVTVDDVLFLRIDPARVSLVPVL